MTNKNLKLIIGVLVVLLLGVTYLWISAAGYFGLGGANSSGERARIERLCGEDADRIDSPECLDELASLTQLLKRFDRQLMKQAPQANVMDISTTTAP